MNQGLAPRWPRPGDTVWLFDVRTGEHVVLPAQAEASHQLDLWFGMDDTLVVDEGDNRRGFDFEKNGRAPEELARCRFACQ